MRMLDTVNAAGFNIEQTDVRLWLYQTSDDKKDKPLIQACSQVQKGFETGGQSQDPEVVEGPASEKDQDQDQAQSDPADVELNSGVSFPGQSLEALMNSALRLSSLNMSNT